MHPVAVVEGSAPVGRRLAGSQRRKRSALKSRGRVNSRPFKQRGCKVHVEGDFIRHRTGPNACRPTHQEGNANAFLVHETLVVPAVVAEKEPVVGRVNHDRVVPEARGIQPCQNAADVFVNGIHATIVVAHIGLVVRLQTRLARQVVRRGFGQVILEVHAVDTGCGHERSRRPVRKVVPQGQRFGQLLQVAIQVARMRLEIVVRRLVAKVQKEGPVAFTGVQPRQGQIGQQIGHVAAVALLPAHFDGGRIPVSALHREDVPIVETSRVRRTAVSQMPLADHGRLVPGPLQPHAERALPVMVNHVVQGPDAGRVAVLAGHDRSAGRSADGVRAEAAVQPQPIRRQGIEVRRPVDPRAIGTNGGRSMVVGHDHNDVGAAHVRSVPQTLWVPGTSLSVDGGGVASPRNSSPGGAVPTAALVRSASRPRTCL